MGEKKIAIFCVSMRGGGAERVISILLSNLYTEYTFYLVLLDHEIQYNLPLDIPIVTLKGGSKSSIINILLLPYLAWQYNNFCRKENIELSISFLSRPNWVNCLVKLIGWKGKVVISERTTPTSHYKKNTLNGYLGLLLMRWLYPLADMIIPNSIGVSLDLKKNLGIRGNYQVIYNPVNTDILQSNLEKKNNIFTYIFVARFQPPKSQLSVIRAFYEIHSKTTSQLFLLGIGELMKLCEEEVFKLNISDRVKFLGFDNNPYVYLNKADCFVMSSEFEGFPNVLLEALSAGLPVICTDCPSGPRELLAPNTDLSFYLKKGVEYAEYGILTPVGDTNALSEAMLDIYKNRKRREKYAKISTLRASNFNISIFVEKFKKIFDDVQSDNFKDK